MCVAIPAKIAEIYEDGKTARASVLGNMLDVNIRLVSVAVGDFVLLHAGCAVEVLREDRAQEILSIYEELENISHEA